MTNRRDFVKFLALIGAGASALPQQIEAFESYYEANTPQGDALIAIDEIFLCGNADTSMPLLCDFLVKDQVRMPLAMNAFGGIIRWAAMPDQKIMVSAPDFNWNIRGTWHGDFADIIRGHISYIGQDRVRKNVPITRARGFLGEAA